MKDGVVQPEQSPRVPVEERLFSLVLALLATEAGLTKSEILTTVQGYRQRYQPGGDNANLERQFERDKDDIRELGVPLETIESPGESGNNQNLRYRIPKGAYELPADVAFTPEELTLIRLASMVWQEGSLSAESRRALIKARGLGGSDADPVLDYVPRLRADENAFEPLSTAIEKNSIVKFDYLKPGQTQAQERVVAPLALVQFQSQWLVYAQEPGTGAKKTFLLRRIANSVTGTGESFDPPVGDHAAEALASLEQVWSANTARIRVEPGTDAATRLPKRRGATEAAEHTYDLHYSDLNLLADDLAAYGPEVLVLSPPELREAVVSRLRRTVVDHG